MSSAEQATSTQQMVTDSDGIPRGMIAALEANLWSMWAQFGRGRGCRLVDEPDLLRFETPIEQVPYNAILRFRVTERIDQTIDGVLDAYQSRGIAPVWIVHPTAEPADLCSRLSARGLVEAEIVPGMVARLEDIADPAPLPDGIAVDEVGSADVDAFVELIAWRYHLTGDAVSTLRTIVDGTRLGESDSPTRAWIARQGPVVLAKAALHVNAGVAGIYGVATRPEARRLGLARHLTAHALVAARTVGAKTSVLHSTPMAADLYRSMGFEQVTQFRLYSLPNALHL